MVWVDEVHELGKRSSTAHRRTRCKFCDNGHLLKPTAFVPQQRIIDRSVSGECQFSRHSSLAGRDRRIRVHEVCYAKDPTFARSRIWIPDKYHGADYLQALGAHPKPLHELR